MQRVFHTSFYSRFLIALSVGLFSACMQLNSLHAEVVAEGDVDPDEDPDLPIFGSPVDINGVATPTGLIRVGIDDIGRLVIDNPSGTTPLVSEGASASDPSAIIGQEDTSVGEVVITGFGSEWEARGLSIVGDRGLAFLSLIGGARYVSRDDLPGPPVFGDAVLIMGNEAGSSAITVIDGFGSRLQAAFLMVGREGDASIDIINRGNMITTFDATIGVTDPDDFDDIQFPTLPALDVLTNDPKPTGRVTVTGLGSRWTIQDSLVIGNDGSNNETGFAVLEIGDQAVVQVGTQESTDGLLINRYGRVELTGGTLRSLIGTSSNVQPILNNGVIMGDGFVQGRINNGTLGEIRNAAGIANLREKLLVTGDVENNNLIESIGGEMEFLAPVDNTVDGDMIFRDAIIRFQDGVTNSGEIAFGGDTTIYGDITSGNTFLVLPDSVAVIRGNLQLDPGAVAAFTVGASVGTMDIIGTAELSDGFLSLNYSAGGVNAQVGDSYDLLTAHEGLIGTFTNTVASAAGLLWDITYSATTVTVTAGGLAVANGADFNGDGIVDAADLAIWQANYGLPSPPALGDADGDGDVDGRDLLEIQRHFGGPPLMAEDGAILAAVPEPSALLLVLSASVCLLGRRRS